MRVLVVEDDKNLATIIRIALEENGYEIKTAGDGKEGYAGYLVFRPDVVVTDICMPRVDGLEMMKQIRAHYPGIKTIYITAQTERFRPRLEQEKKNYSVTVLEKPFSRADLTELIAAKVEVDANPKPPASKENSWRGCNRR